jgi:hypothetical protein
MEGFLRSRSLFLGQNPVTEKGDKDSFTERNDKSPRTPIQKLQSESNIHERSYSYGSISASDVVDDKLDSNSKAGSLLSLGEQVFEMATNYETIQALLNRSYASWTTTYQCYVMEKIKREEQDKMLIPLYQDLKKMRGIAIGLRHIQLVEILNKQIKVLETRRDVSEAISSSIPNSDTDMDKITVLLESVLQSRLNPPAEIGLLEESIMPLYNTLEKQRDLMLALKNDVKALEATKLELERECSELLAKQSEIKDGERKVNSLKIDGNPPQGKSIVVSPSESETSLDEVNITGTETKAIPARPKSILALNYENSKKWGQSLKKATVKLSKKIISNSNLAENSEDAPLSPNSFHREVTLKKPGPAQSSPYHKFLPHTFRTTKKCDYCQDKIRGKEYKCVGKWKFMQLVVIIVTKNVPTCQALAEK